MRKMAMTGEDTVTNGMSAWTAEDDAALSNYTVWQSRLVRPHLGARVLEVGAGTGRLAQLLLASGLSFDRYVALEPSPHFFPVLKARLPNAELENGFVHQLDSSYDGEFDTIFSVHVLEHIEDDLGFLRSLDRLLRPGGRIVVLVPALMSLMSQLDRNVGHFRRYDRSKMRRLARELAYDLPVARYDNLVGVLGWWWLCKVRKTHYQSANEKKTLLGAFRFFDRVVLPLMQRLEQLVPPPVGLNLTAVFRKPAVNSAPI